VTTLCSKPFKIFVHVQKNTDENTKNSEKSIIKKAIVQKLWVMETFDCIFGFSVKRYVRNTINLLCAKIMLTSVIIHQGPTTVERPYWKEEPLFMYQNVRFTNINLDKYSIDLDTEICVIQLCCNHFWIFGIQIIIKINTRMLNFMSCWPYISINLVNETKMVHNILSIFHNFIYNLYMFRISPGPSSGGITVFIWCLVFCYSV